MSRAGRADPGARAGDLYAAAVAAIDAANGEDPNVVVVRARSEPRARVEGSLAVEWIEHLVPGADDALRLAARAHHLRRWEVPRRTYPTGRIGYLRWRTAQKQRHAADVAELLGAVGYPPDVIARVQELVRRERLSTDPQAQAVEDAACLVFIETQLADMELQLDHPHLLEVIRKTARKMSAAGLAAVGSIDAGEAARSLLHEALG